MNFNHAIMVTQLLIIHEQNRPESRFKVVLPYIKKLLESSGDYENGNPNYFSKVHVWV